MKFLANRNPQVVLISLFLFACVTYIKPVSDQSINKIEYDRFWTLKVHSNKKYDMLVIGDSRVYRGISPQAMNEILSGFRIFNFAFSSGILNNEIYEETEKRMKFKDKGIILIGISPTSLIENENKLLHELQKYTKAEVFDKMVTNYLLSKYISPLKPSIVFTPDHSTQTLDLKEIFYPNGWVATSSTEYDHTKYLKSYQEFWSDRKVSDKNIQDLCLRIDKWKRQGYSVFSFRSPASYEIDTLENRLSGFNEIGIRQRIESSGGIWISLEHVYDKYKSYDGIHLDEISARGLSIDIATEIRRLLALER
jgi:hypothetical protein